MYKKYRGAWIAEWSSHSTFEHRYATPGREFEPWWHQTLFRTQAQHLCFIHNSVWFDTIICLSNLSCELWSGKLKIKEIFFKKMYKKYTTSLPFCGMWGSRKTSWNGLANKKHNWYKIARYKTSILYLTQATANSFLCIDPQICLRQNHQNNNLIYGTINLLPTSKQTFS